MMNDLALKVTTEPADGTNQSVYNVAASHMEVHLVTGCLWNEPCIDGFISESLHNKVHSFDTCECLTGRVSTSGVSACLLCQVCVEGGNEYSCLAVNYIRNGITSRFIFPFLGSGFIDGTDFYCISYFVFFAVPGLFTEDNMISC